VPTTVVLNAGLDALPVIRLFSILAENPIQRSPWRQIEASLGSFISIVRWASI